MTYPDCDNEEGWTPGLANPAFTKWVNVYQLEQCYGGPEEGGWYYSAGHPVAAVPFSIKTDEYRIVTLLKSIYGDREHGSLSDSQPSVVFDDLIEPHPPRPFPETRPHYE